MLSLILIGLFYIFTSYASAIGWGTGNMAAFASNANPYYALGHSLWGAGWWFIFIAIVNSAIGCGLACTNAASRVAYTMGQAGTLPARFGKIHPVHRTPTFAIAVQQIIGIVAILLVGTLLAPGHHLRLPRHDHHAGGHRAVHHGQPRADRVHPPRASRRFQHLAARGAPLGRHARAAARAVGDRLPGSAVAVPDHAVPVRRRRCSSGSATWCGAEKRNPGALQRGATMLVGKPADAEGDVDWDDATAPQADA